MKLLVAALVCFAASSFAAAADPSCSAGKRHPTQPNVCCAASCGSTCGATPLQVQGASIAGYSLGCSANNQANNCCATQIKAKNTSCSYGNAPCMITGGAAPGPVSKGADPTCSAGKRHPTQSSVCCAASCGSACGATCVLFNSFTVPIHRVVSTTALRLLGLLQQLVC
eukprot:19909-Heterococcus_DN1.PRE.1